MRNKKIIIMMLAVVVTGFACAQKPTDQIKAIASQFVEGADLQKGEMLEEILAPESMQYVAMGGKLNKFSSEQYIGLVNAKKLGGKPRSVEFQKAEQIGDKLGVAVLTATSSEYKFLYQISMAKDEQDSWKIVGIAAEINGI